MCNGSNSTGSPLEDAEFQRSWLLFIASYCGLGFCLNAAILGINSMSALEKKDFRPFVGGLAVAFAFSAFNRGVFPPPIVRSRTTDLWRNSPGMFRWLWYLVPDFGDWESLLCQLSARSGLFYTLWTNLSIHPLILQRYLVMCREVTAFRLMGTPKKRMAWALLPFCRGVGNITCVLSGKPRAAIFGALALLSLLVHVILVIFYTVRVALTIRAGAKAPRGACLVRREKETRFILAGCWLQTLTPILLSFPITVVSLFKLNNSCTHPMLNLITTELSNLSPVVGAVIIGVVLKPYRFAIARLLTRNNTAFAETVYSTSLPGKRVPRVSKQLG